MEKNKYQAVMMELGISESGTKFSREELARQALEGMRIPGWLIDEVAEKLSAKMAATAGAERKRIWDELKMLRVYQEELETRGKLNAWSGMMLYQDLVNLLVLAA